MRDFSGGPLVDSVLPTLGAQVWGKKKGPEISFSPVLGLLGLQSFLGIDPTLTTCSLLYPHYLKQYSPLSRCSVSTCWLAWKLRSERWTDMIKVTELIYARATRLTLHLLYQVGQWYKESSCSAGGAREVDSIPGLGGFPGEENGNPLQYFCLENSMDREAWWGSSVEHNWACVSTCPSFLENELLQQIKPPVCFLSTLHIAFFFLYETVPTRSMPLMSEMWFDRFDFCF